jgi:NADPH2:quinone reductase
VDRFIKELDMQAMAASAYGTVDVLGWQEMPKPEPGPRDLLISVQASAVNPVDCKIRQGAIPMQRDFPITLGFDVAGVVEAVGSDVELFQQGDAIFASPALNRHGANAPYVLVDERTAAPKPQSLTATEAAALPLVSLTAWEGLFRHAKLHHRETVLIHGGAGGVGHVAVQLAKDQGCRVIATAGRDESIALAQQCGADVVINYKTENVVDRVMELTDQRGCHVVLETVGGENLTHSIQCTGVFGRLVSILGAPQDAPISDLFIKSASLHFEFMGAANMFDMAQAKEQQGEILRTVAEYVEAGKLKPHLSATYSLSDLAQAHQQQETGHTLGKLAITMA